MKKVNSWILFILLFAGVVFVQQYLKDYIKAWFKGDSNTSQVNISQNQIQKADSLIKEIENYSRINSLKLMGIAITRNDSEIHKTLSDKFQPLPTNLEGEFHCTTSSLFGKNSGIAKGKLECRATRNYSTHLVINFIDAKKEFEFFQSDKFKVSGKITNIKIPTSDEVKVIELNKGLILSQEYPTVISISGDPILIRE